MIVPISSPPTPTFVVTSSGSEAAVSRFLDLTLGGVTYGAIYAAVALALVLIWRATRILNFAQGAMAMFSTYIASSLVERHVSYWVALVVALASGALIGAVVERVVVRPV